jgi:hypothetical protein
VAPLVALLAPGRGWRAGCGSAARSDLFAGPGGGGGTTDDAGAPLNPGGAVAVGGTGGGGGVGASGAPGTGGAAAGSGGTFATMSEVIGAPCAASGECAPGLTCLPQGGADFAGGGPSGGLCVADCSLDRQPTCTALDPSSRCVIVDDDGTVAIDDDTAYCFPGCTLGGAPAQKCLGRVNMTCFESNVGGNTGFCQPACNGDFECGSRVCDFALGACVDPDGKAGGSRMCWGSLMTTDAEARATAWASSVSSRRRSGPGLPAPPARSRGTMAGKRARRALPGRGPAATSRVLWTWGP